MPPLRPPTPSEDSESDAPETISLVQSRKSVRKQSADIRRVEVREREKMRLRNRERDRKLKERAVERRGMDEEVLVDGFGEGRVEGRGVGNGEDEDRDDVEARMLRAMNDAGEEASEGAGDSEREFENESSDSMDEDETEGEGDEEEDEEMSADDVDLPSTHPSPHSKSNQNNYLPDELFQAAFSQQANKAKQNVPESKKTVVTTNDKRRKKVSSSSKPKDILVGSKTVRTFQSLKSQPIPSTSNPSTKVNKFLDRALGLKNQKKSLLRKGWERRPANIGILRRNGPAAHFVRNQ